MKRMIRSSYDPTEADLYVVKIWYEVDPGHDVAAPEAAEEIIKVVAGSPDEALERAKMSWSGPIDRIEIVDINPSEYVPDYDDEEPPFEFDYTDSHLPYENYEAHISGSSVVASSKFANNPAREASELIRYINREGVSEHDLIEFFYDNISSTEMIKMMKQLADECDIDLDEFYN